MTSLSVFSRYQFKHLRPGENDKGFAFEGPGLVVICREEQAANVGEQRFVILTALSAPNDALTVAKRLLAHRAGGEKYVYAMLASIQTEGERRAALVELAPRCIEGI